MSRTGHPASLGRSALMLAVSGLTTLLAVAAPGALAGGSQAQPRPDRDSAARTESARTNDVRLPLAFVPNAGQLDSRVRYSAQAGGARFYFTREGMVVAIARGTSAVALRLALLGANPAPTIDGRQLGPGRVNYLLGNDRSKWHANLPTYGRVVYRDLWPGIDMVFRGATDGRLKYELRLEPGADVRHIRLAYRGSRRLSVARAGHLVIDTKFGVLRDQRPQSYQEIGGRRVAVPSSFALAGRTAFGFHVGPYDARRPLVIDPGLVYSTFLGGSGSDDGHAIALDSAGNAYVTGETSSGNFPTTVGAFDPSANGNIDAFVTKLNPAGTGLVYSTYLGGSNSSDRGFGIAVDATGAAYVTGETNSNDFPTTPASFDPTYNMNGDAFVTKLDPAGAALLYSTYLGGTSSDRATGVAIDSAGSAYVTGRTSGGAFPTTAGAFDTSHNGGDDAFVTKLNAAGSLPLTYSTFLGGSADDRGFGIAVDGAASAYVTGETNHSSFPTTAGAFDTSHNGSFDVFVTKLNAAGSSPLAYSTFLGGGGDDRGRGIALDATGSAHLTGIALAGFPTTAGSADTSHNGGDDAFATKLNPTGSAPLVYSTYLGGGGADRGFAVALDQAGNTYLTGETDGSFPTTLGAFDISRSAVDAFVTKLNTSGALLYSTFLGGTGDDRGRGIAVDAADDAYVTGRTESSNFPTTPGAFDTSYNTNGDAFVTKLDAVGAPTTLVLAPATATNPVGTTHTVTATVRDTAAQPVQGIVVRFTVTGPGATTGTCTTAANGQCSFSYLGPTTPGTDSISAFADTDGDGVRDMTPPPPEPVGTASKTWVPGPPATLVLSPPAARNQVATPHTVTATSRDAFGNPTPGIVVRFAVTGPGATTGSCTTGATGQCTFTYTGPTTVGTDAITAFADTDADGTNDDPGEPEGAAAKTWTPGPPASVVLDPAADTNPVGTSHTVTATVRDAFGNSNPDIVVRFGVTGAVTASGQCTTDAGGQCDFSYDGPTVPGADAITAFADTNDNGTRDGTEPAGAATKTWVPGDPATVVLTPSTATNTVGTSHTVTAAVKDAFGNPTPNIVVRFTVTGPGAAAGTCTTDAAGECGFTYTGPTLVGTDAITAFADTNDDGDQDAGEPGGAASKVWTPGPPATLVLDPATATNPVGTSHTVTAIVADAFGNPTPDVVVRFTVSGSVTATGGCTTGPDGRCSFAYTGPTLPGADAISAFADTNGNGTADPGEPPAAAEKTWVPGPAATLLLTPAAAVNPTGTTHTVTATVRDAFGNATPNVLVRFSVTGANATTGSCTTAQNGQCSFAYLGTQAGADAIAAFADANEDGTQQAGEPGGTATKTWTVPTSGCPANGGDDDEDDDGLEDRDESLFGTLLGNADSDDDGRRDGNDDGDDDGEDDEDEDDDSDDECSNDSDGDGEDDEDEDDD